MARRPTESYVADIPSVALSIDPEAFDEAIRNQGVRLIHYRGMRCPVGMTDIGDNRRPHEDHAGCSNGFLYEKAGTIRGLFVGNSNGPQLRDVGFVDGASVTVTFPRTYADECTPPLEFFVAPFDRFYLDEEAITVSTWQLVKYNASGSDRLAFPAVEVDSLIDARGIRYEQCRDFEIVNGLIVWQPKGNRPGVDLETNKGVIYSIRYRYRPFWYCARLLHEIRVAQVENPMLDSRSLIRMPQQILLNREFLFMNESNDNMAIDPRTATSKADSPRQHQAAEDEGFGPR